MTFGCLWRVLGLSAFLLIAGLASPPTAAQETPPNLTASEIERLLTTLEDPEARQKFIEQLRTLVNAHRAVEPPPAAPVPDRVATRFLEMLSQQITTLGESVFRAAAFISDAPKLYGWFQEELGDPDNRLRLLEIFAKVAIVLLAGWAAEYVAARLVARPRRWVETRPAGERWARIPYAVLLALIAAVPVVVFVAVAFGTLVLVEPARVTRLVALALINANLLARAVLLVVGILLVPHVPALRPLPLSDETAAYIHVWARRLTSIAVYGYFISGAALLLGIPSAGYQFLLKLLGLVIASLLVILVLQNRAAVAQALIAAANIGTPEQPTPEALRGTRRLVAEYWHVVAILYIAAVFAVWLIRPDQGFAFVLRATLFTAIVIVLARAAARFAIRGMAYVFRVTDDVRQRFPTLEARANRYLQVFNVVAKTVIYGIAALMVLQAWGFESLEWISSPGGRRVGTSAISLAITMFIALMLWEGLNAVLERYAKNAFGLESTRRSARGRTLITLAQRALAALIAVLVGLVFLSEIGVNIAPLLAGAGVVGLAVGLGAQTLVKNLLEGVANLIEDTFAVGDVVKLGDLAGVVEEISMRAVHLRDFSGHVHTIPFSEIKTVTNMTRDFAFAVFDVGVSYKADVDRVCEVLQKEAAEMRADPQIGSFIAGDLEIVGLDNFGDSAITIKARFRTLPGKQWPVKRAFNRRIKIAFDREGIEIPFPQRTVHVVGDPKLLGPAASSAGT